MKHIDRQWLADILMQRSVQISESGCLIWMGAMSTNGYGSMRICSKGYSTHRLSYYAFNGDIPDGMSVLHSCDIRSCVNPNHLRAGTYQDNQRDRLIRGRHHKTNLRPDDVIEILDALKHSDIKKVSIDFGISITALYQIRSGSSWNWLNDKGDDE